MDQPEPSKESNQPDVVAVVGTCALTLGVVPSLLALTAPPGYGPLFLAYMLWAAPGYYVVAVLCGMTVFFWRFGLWRLAVLLSGFVGLIFTSWLWRR